MIRLFTNIKRDFIHGLKDSVHFHPYFSPLLLIALPLLFLPGEYIYHITEWILVGHVLWRHTWNSKPIVIRWLCAYIIDYWLVWSNLERLSEWVPLGEDFLLPLYFSYHVFDLFLVSSGRSFGDRFDYFKERFPYFTGYGLLLTIFYLCDLSLCYCVMMIIMLNSHAIHMPHDKCPQYANYLPHITSKYDTDLEDVLEQCGQSIYNFLTKRNGKLFKKMRFKQC